MRARTLTLAAALGLLVTATSQPAAAQGPANLAEVERAYSEVDLPETLRLAKAAIEAGGQDARATGRLYLLWALSAAALDQPTEARDAFSIVLAIDRNVKLERSLSPKVRAPYLEARGRLGVDTEAPALEARLATEGDQLVVRTRDVLSVAHRLEVGLRWHGSSSFSRRVLEPSPEVYIDVPSPRQGDRLEYFLRVNDAHGNALFEKASAASPAQLSLAKAPATGDSLAPGRVDRPNRTPYYVTAGALGALGVAAGAGSALFYLQREDAAKEWNGPDCERPGRSRAEQCGDIDDRRATAETLSIALGAGGGALIIGSVVTLLLAPSSAAPRPELGAWLGPGQFGLSYRGTM
jgi:hypothetical protein